MIFKNQTFSISLLPPLKSRHGNFAGLNKLKNSVLSNLMLVNTNNAATHKTILVSVLPVFCWQGTEGAALSSTPCLS